MANAADKVQDRIIQEDVSIARVAGDLQNKIAKRLNKLGRDLKALTVEVDVAGTPRRDAQQSRMAKLNKESRVLIREAYKDINQMTNADGRKVVNAVSMDTVTALEDAIP